MKVLTVENTETLKKELWTANNFAGIIKSTEADNSEAANAFLEIVESMRFILGNNDNRVDEELWGYMGEMQDGEWEFTFG